MTCLGRNLKREHGTGNQQPDYTCGGKYVHCTMYRLYTKQYTIYSIHYIYYTVYSIQHQLYNEKVERALSNTAGPLLSAPLLPAVFEAKVWYAQLM